jgi:small subunit ribosomal protein S10
MIYIYLRSYNNKSINSTVKLIDYFLSNLMFRRKSIINLPLIIKKYTVNRSPHVFSKSKEQFELRTWRKVIILDNKSSIFYVKNLNKFLVKFIKTDVNIKIKYI